MSDRRTDSEGLRREVLRAEATIIELNRKLTAAIVEKRATGSLSAELNETIDSRDVMVARLKRLTATAH